MDFAIKNNILDCNGFTAQKAIFIYGGQKWLAKVIDNNSEFYDSNIRLFREYSKSRDLSKEKKADKKEKETEMFKSYSESLDYFKKRNESKKFRDLANASLFMDMFVGKFGEKCRRPSELVKQIASYSIPDNGNKLLV